MEFGSVFAPLADASNTITIALAYNPGSVVDALFCCNSFTGGNRHIYQVVNDRFVINNGQISNLEDPALNTVVVSINATTNQLIVMHDGNILFNDTTTAAASDFVSTDLWAIATEYDAGPTPSNFSNLSLCEVRLFDTDLTAAQMQAIHTDFVRIYDD
jgi:hypothetical protein